MYANALFHLIFPLACLLSTATCAVSWTASSTGRCLQSSRALGGFRSNNGGVHGKDFSGCGRSSCADQRFLGRRGDLVPWSWIIVRVFKAKSGGYPKVNGPAEFLPGTLRSTHSQESKITAREAMILVHELTAHTVGGVIGRSETIMQIIPRADELVIEAKVAPEDIDQGASRAAAVVRIMAGSASLAATNTMDWNRCWSHHGTWASPSVLTSVLGDLHDTVTPSHLSWRICLAPASS
jgi:hypothetical protein